MKGHPIGLLTDLWTSAHYLPCARASIELRWTLSRPNVAARSIVSPIEKEKTGVHTRKIVRWSVFDNRQLSGARETSCGEHLEKVGHAA
jgi:hypothetical protein